ncbi:MAG: hypothetical protein OXT65_00065 [Alphaproteobacteria bacterium]|nr:hypothetical protein [Alphaproteobacteria bacterium]
MDFKKSGLPQHPLVEKAFNFSYTALDKLRREAIKTTAFRFEEMRQKQHEILDAKKEAGDITDDQLKLQKEVVDKQFALRAKTIPMAVGVSLDKQFLSHRVGPAKYLVDNSDNAQPETIAAILATDAARTPVDFREVEKELGTAVADLVADIRHMDTYHHGSADHLKASGDETKRAFIAMMAAGFEQANDEISGLLKGAPPGTVKINREGGQDDLVTANLGAAWGVDDKLQKALMGSYNKMSVTIGSPMRIELDKQGLPELVKDMSVAPPTPQLPPPANGNKKPPNKPPKPPGGGMSGDVF